MAGPRIHPRHNDEGKKVPIHKPHEASPAQAWGSSTALVTVTPGGAVPPELNGVAFAPWADAPQTPEEWAAVAGQAEIEEPEFVCPDDKEPAAGVVVQESDGRFWLVSPTNGFGGYRNTFPKGRLDDGISLQACAIREAFEESGLQVAITGFLCDVDRTVTRCRYYTARRVGGTPAEMGWESQAVRLAPPSALAALLNGAADKPVMAALDDAADSDRYLGSPAVVERLVQGFCHRVLQFCKWRRQGMIDAAELARHVTTEAHQVGRIFMGEEPSFRAMPSWNSRRNLDLRVTVLLGAEKVQAAGSGGAALFEWLGVQVMSAYLQADTEASADEVGRRLSKTISSVIDNLLCTSE